MTDKYFVLFIVLLLFRSFDAQANDTTEFCLTGEFDLGTRYQGAEPKSGEMYPTTWCVVTDQESSRVFYSLIGRSNADIDGAWAVAYLPPDTVRIIDQDAGQIIEFEGTDNSEEARRLRRVDPRRLFEEVRLTGVPSSLQVDIRDETVVRVLTTIDLPLRGSVDVSWLWNWKNENEPVLRLIVDNELLYTATGKWRVVPDVESEKLWMNSTAANIVQVPGDHWPAQVDMRLVNLTDDVYLVQGVRSGFQHIVVDTPGGLVVGDAPAGWVEFHHIPPSDLVPGLGVSGLSEKFIDFLASELPGRPIKAVALTHFHDDHAGGARAFAATGASVYAPEGAADFLESAFNRPAYPNDRFRALSKNLVVQRVTDRVILNVSNPTIELVELGQGPHVSSSIGIWVGKPGYFFQSDLHVPNSDADAPRAQRAITECWFARWASDNLPIDTIVLSSHTEQTTPVSRLVRYVESEACNSTKL